MAESSRFWTTNGTGDGPSGGYTAQQFYDFLRKLLISDQQASQGVIFGEQNQLSCSGSSSPIVVNTGSAIVYGFFYENTATVNLTVTTPIVGTTGGRVNLKADWTAQTVRLVANRNTDGVSTPPGLTQSAGSVWEMPLYTFTITTGGVITLTDVRKFIQIGTQLQTDAVDTAAIQANAVTDAKLRTSAATSVIGRSATSSGNVADISASSDGQILRRSGTSLGFGQLTLLGIPDALITGAKIATGTITPDNIENRTRMFYVHPVPADTLAIEANGYVMPNNVTTVIYGHFRVPDDYVSGIQIAPILIPQASGNIREGNKGNAGADGEAYNTHNTDVGLTTWAVTINEIETPGGIAVWSDLAAGDFVQVEFTRYGADAADTINAAVNFRGFLVQYTADS